ncbi:hypothetical protein P167DRAFT_579143 [Morchella conica CCBAS932]|uniref:NACHT domain-containing protein n=1 Tax=Morchella conica CCBAS932 TaxID=1392247 RepID=A0A3N4KP37_9PEZI|nr:hypothetical protein P167DRAFT_579143 [Morchella conica CCBAS932]
MSDFHRCLDPTSPEYPSVRGILKGLETILSNGDGLCKNDKKKFDRLVKDIGALVEKLSTVASLEGDPRFDTDKINQSLAILTAALDEADQKRAEETIEQQKHRLKVENYIESAVSTEKEYDEAKRERLPGTSDWILSKTEFTNWLCPRGGINTSGILWTYGGAGMEPDNIHNSILDFPVGQTKSSSLEIVRRFQSTHNGAVTTVLWETFEAVLKDINGCYLILDWLDECLDFDPTSRSRRSGEMRIFMEKLINSIPSSTGVKLLIMSRDVVAISSMLEPLRSLNPPVTTTTTFKEYQINSEDNKADIKSFSGNLSDSLGFCDKDKAAICDKLSERCEGMFLWARLGGERLHAGMGSKRLETVLTEMPPGLDHTYGRNLQTILKKEKYYQDQAIAICRLVLFCYRNHGTLF